MLKMLLNCLGNAWLGEQGTLTALWLCFGGGEGLVPALQAKLAACRSRAAGGPSACSAFSEKSAVDCSGINVDLWQMPSQISLKNLLFGGRLCFTCAVIPVIGVSITVAQLWVKVRAGIQ